MRRKTREAIAGYSFLGPNIVGFLVFTSFPVAASLIISFLHWDILRAPDWAKPAIMVMGIWKNAGYNMLLYLVGLQGIPEEYYEASKIEGIVLTGLKG